jgi:hypothetical protein
LGEGQSQNVEIPQNVVCGKDVEKRTYSFVGDRREASLIVG